MNIKKLISKMNLEEKAALCSGDDFWHTKAIERLGIKRMMLSDGPHGLRKQDLKADYLGINNSIKAVCFPTASAIASSFNRELIFSMGKSLGEACQSENVSVLLGPAVNIKRSPLCGRNFEYFSEDPYLTTEIATSHIKGVQSQNIGTSIKHYLANNQEHRRLTGSSEIDERTLREIYLAAFEGAVVNGKPWTVMCSYNKVNGVQVSESHRFLTEVLREEWGFNGCVVSDWGAVRDRIKGIKAGLDLEMPSSNGINDKLIVDAVKNGKLEEKVLDLAVERILKFICKYEEGRKKYIKLDKEKQHELARKIEGESIVLLKNDEILPLDSNDETAFIGLFASKPRFQGGGSSHINAFKVESALEAVKSKQSVLYAQGYEINNDTINEKLINEAVEIAKKVKNVVVFVGLPDSFESEGYDRKHMNIPIGQNALIEAITEVQPNTVVVLHNGAPVEMPWVNRVKGIVEVYLGGEAVGSATIDVLYGDINPSGKLAETFPIKLEDNPSYVFYLGERDKVEYREGIFVGYRYYDKKDMDVLFPFGYGLSYTTFEYSNLQINKSKIKDNEKIDISVEVINSGKFFGKDVVQLYVEDVESTVIRPVRELRGFEKVALKPGEIKVINFTLSKRDFAYYNTEINNWHVESGYFNICVGKSSRDIILRKSLFVESTVELPIIYDDNSTIGDILSNSEKRMIIKPLIDKYNAQSNVNEESDSSAAMEAITEEMLKATFNYMPLRHLVTMAEVCNYEELNEIIKKLNK